MCSGYSIGNLPKYIGKVVAVEVGVACLAITSTIETIAYICLTILSLPVLVVSDKPYQFSAKLLQSSSFTILWSVADGVFYNIICPNVMTHESFARYWAHLYNPTRIRMLRREDRVYFANRLLDNGWRVVNNALLLPIAREGRRMQTIIEAGVTCLKDDVYAHFNEKAKEAFKEMDARVFLLVAMRAAFVYSVGKKKGEAIPQFFKLETQDLIRTFRNDFPFAECPIDGTNLDAFEKGMEPSHREFEVFQRLRAIGSSELQGGILLTECYLKAIPNSDSE